MCNACNNYCCGFDAFYKCGCDDCFNPACHSDEPLDEDDLNFYCDEFFKNCIDITDEIKNAKEGQG